MLRKGIREELVIKMERIILVRSPFAASDLVRTYMGMNGSMGVIDRL